MFVFGLFLKLLYKLKLSNIIYPILCYINNFIPNMRLPNVQRSKKIILNASHHKCSHNNYCNVICNNGTSGKYDVQIIVPVYNSEKYVEECLNSIINQKTEYKFHIIVVNDGSTDNTDNILKLYKNNPLITIINENNRGRSAARNEGLKYVTSKYVMFADSDDKLAPNAIQTLIHNACITCSDIVFGSCITFDRNGKLDTHFSRYTNNNNIHIRYDNDVDDSVCAKVFKSNLFNGIRFPEGYEFEDMMPAFWIYPRCWRMSSISNIVYYYRYNPLSITHSFQFTNISIDSFLILSILIKSLLKYNIDINQYIYNTFLRQVKMTCMRNIYIRTKIQKSIFVLICNLYNKYFINFSTNLSYFKPLEKSLKNKDYNNYILFCIMK